MAGNGQLTRRDFLIAVNSAAALLLLESCVPGLGKPSPTPTPAGGTPEERAFLLLQEAVRASPDHLAYRAADLVKGRDAGKIADFVRDHFSVLPPWSSGEDVRVARRWGSAATIRGGQGTLRERADVLADLLNRAGFKAQVMAANRPSAIGAQQLYQPRVTQFAPDTGKVGQAGAQLKGAGYPAPDKQQAFDPGADPVAAILGALPASVQQARLRPDLLPDQVPVVRFSDGSRTRYAFALGGLEVSDSAPAGLAGAGDAADTPAIGITISAISNPPLGSSTPAGQVLELVKGRWKLEDVVGRQVLLTFVPPEGPKALLESLPSSLPIRVPVLRVQADDPTAPKNAGLVVAGARVTVQGDVIGPAPTPGGPSPSPAATVDGPFGPLQVLSDSDRKAAIAKVAKVAVSVNASAFPDVELSIGLTDSAGNSVDGLDATSFAVKEQGAAVDGFAVYSNVRTQKLPRVLLVADAGLGQQWSSPAAMTAWAKGIASALAGLASSAPFETQVVGLGGSPQPGSWSPPNADAIAAALQNVYEAADDPWPTLGGSALDQGVVAFVMLSDNDPADMDLVKGPSLQRRFASAHVPAFTLPYGPVSEEQTKLIVDLGGGSRLPYSDPGTPVALAALLKPLLVGWQGVAYRARYRASTSGPNQRAVTVGLAGVTQPAGTAGYTVPAQPLAPPSFAGLYATIDLPTGSVTRRLAGLELTDRGGPMGALDDPVAVAETRAALDGITTFAVEPGTPTSAALLDDVLKGFISVVPLVPLLKKPNPDQLLSAAAKGIHRTPFYLPAVLRPTAVDPGALPGLRLAIFQERALTADAIQEHVDLAVGGNPLVPIGSDAAAAFKAAVATSVHATAAEAATFPDSAYHRLSGQKLQPVVVNDFTARDAFLATVPAARQAAWRYALTTYTDYHLVVPEKGAAEAFWVVDPNSGAGKAVLLDSTGGAMTLVACKSDAFDELALCVAELSIFCSLSPAGYSFYCVGINVLAVGLSVIILFDPERRDFGTPYGIVLPFIGLGEAGLGGIEASIGVMLMLLTIQKSCS